MRHGLGLAALLAAIVFASTTALALNPQPLPPGSHPPPPPHPEITLPPPAPVGKCKTDATLKDSCTTMWNSCVSAKNGAAAVCKYDWKACCTNKVIRRF